MIKMNKKTKKLLILTSIIYMLNALIILAFSYSTAKVMECAELGQTKKLPYAVLTLLGVILLGRIISLSSTAVNQWYISSGEKHSLASNPALPQTGRCLLYESVPE